MTTLFKKSLFVFDQKRQLIDHVSKVLKQSSLYCVRLIDRRNTIADVGITGMAVIDVIYHFIDTLLAFRDSGVDGIVYVLDTGYFRTNAIKDAVCTVDIFDAAV